MGTKFDLTCLVEGLPVVRNFEACFMRQFVGSVSSWWSVVVVALVMRNAVLCKRGHGSCVTGGAHKHRAFVAIKRNLCWVVRLHSGSVLRCPCGSVPFRMKMPHLVRLGSSAQKQP